MSKDGQLDKQVEAAFWDFVDLVSEAPQYGVKETKEFLMKSIEKIQTELNNNNMLLDFIALGRAFDSDATIARTDDEYFSIAGEKININIDTDLLRTLHKKAVEVREKFLQNEALDGILTKTLGRAKEMTGAQVSDEQAKELGVLMLRLTEEAQIKMSERGVLFNLVELGRVAAEGDASLSDDACLEILAEKQEKFDLPLDLFKQMHEKAVEVNHKYEELKRSWGVEPLELLEGIRAHNRTKIINAVKAIAKELKWNPGEGRGIQYADRVKKSFHETSLLFKELLAAKEDSALFTEMMLDKDVRELVDKVSILEQSKEVGLLEECRRLGKGIDVLQKTNQGAFEILQRAITEEGSLVEMDSAIKETIAKLRELPKEDAKLAIPAFFRMIADIKNPENKNSAIKAMGKTQDLKLNICAKCHGGKADWLIRVVFPNDMKMLDVAKERGITINKPFLQKITNWVYQRALSSAKNFNKPPIWAGWLFKRFKDLSEERKADILGVVEPSKAAAILTAMDAEVAAKIVGKMDAEVAVKIVEQMDSAKAILILKGISNKDAILGQVSDPDKKTLLTDALRFCDMATTKSQGACDEISKNIEKNAKTVAVLDAKTIKAICERIEESKAAKIVGEMDAGVAAKIMGEMDEEVAAKIVGKMDAGVAAKIVEKMDAGVAAKIVEKMDAGVAAKIVGEMDVSARLGIWNGISASAIVGILKEAGQDKQLGFLPEMRATKAVAVLNEMGSDEKKVLLTQLLSINPRDTGNILGKMESQEAVDFLLGVGTSKTEDILYGMNGVSEFIGKMNSENAARVLKSGSPFEVAEILVAVQKVYTMKNVVEIVNRMDSGEVAAIFNTNTSGKFLKVKSGQEKFRDLVLKELSEEKRNKVLDAMLEEKRESYLKRMAPENVEARRLSNEVNEAKTKEDLSKSGRGEEKKMVKDIKEVIAGQVRSANLEFYRTPPLKPSVRPRNR